MRWSGGRRWLAYTLVAAIVVARSARAEPCSALTIEADESTSARYPELADRIRRASVQLVDVDRCARVKLATSEAAASISIQVALPDGRSTTRSVSREEDVLPAIEGLLLVPRPPDGRSEALAPAPASTPDGSGEPRMETVVRPTFDRPRSGERASIPPPAPSTAEGSALRIELSALMIALAGDGQGGAGAGIASFLDLRGWLAGFLGRMDFYQAFDTGEPPGAAIMLAAIGGRRIALGRSGVVSLDLMGGPALAYQGENTNTQQDGPRGRPIRQTTSSTVPRLILAPRLVFGARSHLRSFVGLNAELGPGRESDASFTGLVHHLPTWAFGLARGGTVGTL